MDEYNRKVGQRLKKIRNIFNEGSKLSAKQFGFLLGMNRDKIANYESGRSSIPVSLIYSLYIRGINPIFLISGEGSVFADNQAGRDFKEKIERKMRSRNSNVLTNVREVPADMLDEINELNNSKRYRAAAGKINKG